MPDAVVFLADLLLCRVHQPRDANMPEILKAHVDGTISAAEGRKELHPQPGNDSQIREADGAA